MLPQVALLSAVLKNEVPHTVILSSIWHVFRKKNNQITFLNTDVMNSSMGVRNNVEVVTSGLKDETLFIQVTSFASTMLTM